MTEVKPKSKPFIPARGAQGFTDESRYSRDIDSLMMQRYSLARFLKDKRSLVAVACTLLMVFLTVATYTIFPQVPHFMRIVYVGMVAVYSGAQYFSFRANKKDQDMDLATDLANRSFVLALQQNENQTPGNRMTLDQIILKARGLVFDRRNMDQSLMNRIDRVFEDYRAAEIERVKQYEAKAYAERAKMELRAYMHSEIKAAGLPIKDMDKLTVRDTMIELARLGSDPTLPRKLFNQMKWDQRSQ